MLSDARGSQDHLTQPVPFTPIKVALGLQLVDLSAKFSVLVLQPLHVLSQILVPLLLPGAKSRRSSCVTMSLFVSLTRALVNIQRNGDVLPCVCLQGEVRLRIGAPRSSATTNLQSIHDR